MNLLTRTAVSMLCALVFLPQALCARPVAVSFSARTPFNSSVRSAVFPGWGQSFNEQETKGYMIGGAFVAAGIATYILNARASKTYEDYERLGIKDDSLYSSYEAQSSQAALASYLTAGVWLYGVIDAFIFGKAEAPRPEQYSQKEGLKLAWERRDLCLRYTRRF